MKGLTHTTKTIIWVIALTAALVVVLLVSTTRNDGRVAGNDPSEDRLSAMLTNVEPTTFLELINQQDTIILDVRTPEEYEQERIEGARNIDFYAPDFAQTLAALDRNAPYAVYCRSGNRSGQTLELMRSMGFTNVTHLTGGILAWNARGYSVCQRC
jgi:phage shock protein E